MPRIPEEEIVRLKAGTDLAALVTAAGVELRPVGQDLRGKCPFHDDHGPSLVVTPSKNLWHCLGACGAGGSVIDWVMKRQGVSFRHAVELLRAKSVPAGGAAVKKSTIRHLPPPVALDADDRKLLRQVVDFYHETLQNSPEALAYLGERGILSGEVVNRFRLGYANRTLGYRLPERNRKTGAELRGRLEKLGLYRKSGHEHFAGCLVIPILDETGNVQGIYGRKIASARRPDLPAHLYLPGPHQGVWNVEALAAAKEIILCEALIDALTFWAAGFRNVTASYGVHGFTKDHVAAFEKYRTTKVFLAYDGDEAGERAARELTPKLAERGIDVARVGFPVGMDANDYARRFPPASRSLGELLGMALVLASAPRTAPEAPPPVTAPSPLRVEGDQAQLVIGDRSYRVRGLSKNLSAEQLRVNVRVSKGERFHVDTFDLFAARPRQAFVKEAAREIETKPDVLQKDLGHLLFHLEELQDERIREATAPKKRDVLLSDAEKEAALGLLRDPDLLPRLLADFARIGVIGEETNTLVGYLAAVSRKMEEPLALLLQSNSAAGKSALLDAVLSLMPEEEVERFTALTGQSLYYMADTDLAHKILAIAEVEGAERAGYAIKMLQSEGRISIATTGKDPETGELRTKRHEVQGPVAILMTTTRAEIDAELQNRAIVLTVNEDREQTRAIHEAQRSAQTLPGLLARQDREAVLRLHRNAQRLLRPIPVVNPWAGRLTFVDAQLRTRRDHVKYLTLIRAIAFLHQFQRPGKEVEHGGRRVPYIEATLSDVAIANRLAGEVLGRSLDELAPPTRRLLFLIDEMVAARGGDRSEVRFTRRELREATRWGDTQLRLHLGRLVDLEYVLVHRGGRGQSFVYELLYDGSGKDGKPFLVGLLDVEGLRHEYESNLAGGNGPLAGPWRPLRGGVAAGSRVGKTVAPAPGEPADRGIAEIAPAARI